MEQEIWKDVVGYEGLYQVSNLGRLISCEKKVGNGHIFPRKEKVLIKKRSGYLGTSIVDAKGVSKNVLIHRLVAFAFIPNPNSYPQIDHIDGDKENNCVDNLRWCTPKQNINFPLSLLHRSQKGKIAQNKKETIEKKIASSHKKTIIQYDMQMNVIREWESLRAIGRKYGFNISNISANANGRKRSAYGYIWKYKEAKR